MLKNVIRSIIDTHSMHPFTLKIGNSFHDRVSLINFYLEEKLLLHYSSSDRSHDGDD